MEFLLLSMTIAMVVKLIWNTTAGCGIHCKWEGNNARLHLALCMLLLPVNNARIINLKYHSHLSYYIYVFKKLDITYIPLIQAIEMHSTKNA